MVGRGSSLKSRTSDADSNSSSRQGHHPCSGVRLRLLLRVLCWLLRGLRLRLRLRGLRLRERLRLTLLGDLPLDCCSSRWGGGGGVLLLLPRR